MHTIFTLAAIALCWWLLIDDIRARRRLRALEQQRIYEGMLIRKRVNELFPEQKR